MHACSARAAPALLAYVLTRQVLLAQGGRGTGGQAGMHMCSCAGEHLCRETGEHTCKQSQQIKHKLTHFAEGDDEGGADRSSRPPAEQSTLQVEHPTKFT